MSDLVESEECDVTTLVAKQTQQIVSKQLALQELIILYKHSCSMCQEMNDCHGSCIDDAA